MKIDSKSQDQYEAVIHGVGWHDLSQRGKLQITGVDRITFLHAMISNDLEGLQDYHGKYGTFLTARGKILSDFFYYRLPNLVLMDMEPSLAKITKEALESYVIMDEVHLKVSNEFSHFSLQGPASSQLIQELFQVDRPSSHLQLVEVQWEGNPAWLIHKADVGVSGFEVILSRGASHSFSQFLLERGKSLLVKKINSEVWNILRIEAAIPRYGVDMDENNYPMEARLDSAISLTKGCYLGQEVVAKATYIGGVGRFLTCLKFESDHVPCPKARVFSIEGKDIGFVTSATVSPRLDRPIALAYVKRSFASSGELLQVELSGEELARAEVVNDFKDRISDTGSGD